MCFLIDSVWYFVRLAARAALLAAVPVSFSVFQLKVHPPSPVEASIFTALLAAGLMGIDVLKVVIKEFWESAGPIIREKAEESLPEGTRHRRRARL